MIFNFKRISLDDKKKFKEVFTRCQPQLSEYSFINIFTWGDYYDFYYAEYEDGLIFKDTFNNETYLTAPAGFKDRKRIYRLLIDYAKNNNIKKIKLIPSYHLRDLPDNLKIIEDIDNYDYLYKTENLAYLKGARYDGKRGFIKKFIENYDFDYVKYETKYKSVVLEFLKEWYKNREESIYLNAERKAITKLLDNYEYFEAIGAMIFAKEKNSNKEKRLCGLTFGEKLNNRTFVIHFEKADTNFIGSYQIINNYFVKNELVGRYLFVNREQDLGIDGLRKAKRSYYPVRMIKKYIAIIN